MTKTLLAVQAIALALLLVLVGCAGESQIAGKPFGKSPLMSVQLGLSVSAFSMRQTFGAFPKLLRDTYIVPSFLGCTFIQDIKPPLSCVGLLVFRAISSPGPLFIKSSIR